MVKKRIYGVKLWKTETERVSVIVYFKGTWGSRLRKLRIKIFWTSDLTDWS